MNENTQEILCRKYNIPMIYRSELDNRELFWCKVDKIAKAFPKMDVIDKEVLTIIYGGIRYSALISCMLIQWNLLTDNKEE